MSRQWDRAGRNYSGSLAHWLMMVSLMGWPIWQESLLALRTRSFKGKPKKVSQKEIFFVNLADFFAKLQTPMTFQYTGRRVDFDNFTQKTY